MQQEPIELKKRLEEVRLLESRRSARLADQERDTDFARLADMGGDRRRTSHSIEVPLSLTPQHNSRKRPPSYAHECSSDQCNEEEMNECNAAMILVTLSNSPKSPKNADKWFGSSPGSSSASWSSGSSSPPLSDDGHVVNALLHGASASARIRTTSVSTSDEGIVVDFKEDAPRKKRSGPASGRRAPRDPPEPSAHCPPEHTSTPISRSRRVIAPFSAFASSALCSFVPRLSRKHNNNNNNNTKN